MDNQFQDISMEFSLFDAISSKLQTNNLQQSTYLKQKITFSLAYTDKWNQGQIHEIQAVGADSSRIDTYNQIAQQIKKQNASDVLTNFKFTFKQNVGDKFAHYYKFIRVSDGQQVDLIHKKNEILLVDVWATWCGPCQIPMDHNQNMLLKHQENWKRKVRIVGVSVDQNIQDVRERIDKKQWGNIQHLTLQGWNGDHELMRNFKISGIPFVILVDQDGVIDFVGHPSEIKLEQRISQLLSKKPQNKEQKKKQNYQYDEGNEGYQTINIQTYKTILDNISLIQKSIQNVPGFVFTLSLSKSLNNGKTKVIIQKPRLDFIATPEQKDLRNQIFQIIFKDIAKNSIDNHSYVYDQQVDLNQHISYLTNLSKQYKISHPYMQQTHYINVLDPTKSSMSKSLVFPPVLLKKQISVSDLIQLRSKITNYSKTLISRNVSNVTKIIQQTIPINLIGQQFFGLSNLINSKTKTITLLQPLPGHIQLIAVYFIATFSQKFIDNLLSIARTIPNAHISVICPNQIPQQLFNTQTNSSEFLTAYSNAANSKEIQIMRVTSPEYLMVIDENGLVLHEGAVEVGKVKEVINEGRKRIKRKGVWVEGIGEVEKVLEGKEVKELRERVKGLDYTPKFEVEYLKNTDANTFTLPKITIVFRQTDKQLITPFTILLQPHSTLHLTLLQTFTIPPLTLCSFCSHPLSLPCSFLFFTSPPSFLCLPCFSTHSPTTNPILLFSQCPSVDLSRFGQNIQPINQQEKKKPEFICSGCKWVVEGIRWICMGCRREPNNKGDYVDFCEGCVEKMVKGEWDKGIGKSREEEGHEKEHPLLRVEYAPHGYMHW